MRTDPRLAAAGARPPLAWRSPRALAVLVATASLGACSHTAPRPHAVVAPASSPVPPPDHATVVAGARAARDRALAVRPSSDLERASDDEIADALRRWAIARRDATQDAHRAFGEALEGAVDPSERAQLHGELADLWLRLEEDTRSALLEATPPPHRSEPSLVSSLESEIARALRPLRDRVAAQLAACRRIVDEAHLVGAAAETCAAVARRLEPGTPSGAEATARPILATTRPRPCTFKGTLATRGTVYSDETGTSALLAIDSRAPIEVEALQVAKRAGGRYKIAVAWPKVVEGYLGAEEAPFVLMRRVELVPDAVWVAQGQRVAASDERGPTVRVTRAFGDPVGGASPRRPAPDALDRRLFCHDLELATMLPGQVPAAHGASRGARVHLATNVAVPLFARAGGPSVASVVAVDVELLERSGSFAHVAGDAPFDFDGWVDASFLR